MSAKPPREAPRSSRLPRMAVSSRPPTRSSGRRSRTGGLRLRGSREQRRGEGTEVAVALRAHGQVAVPGEVEAARQLLEGWKPLAAPLELAQVVPVAQGG